MQIPPVTPESVLNGALTRSFSFGFISPNADRGFGAYRLYQTPLQSGRTVVAAVAVNPAALALLQGRPLAEPTRRAVARVLQSTMASDSDALKRTPNALSLG